MSLAQNTEIPNGAAAAETAQTKASATNKDLESLSSAVDTLTLDQGSNSSQNISESNSASRGDMHDGISQGSGESGTPSSTATIMEVNQQVSESDIRSAFQKFSDRIVTVELIPEYASRRWLSARVTFTDPATAEEAVRCTRPLFLGSRLCHAEVGTKGEAVHNHQWRFGPGDLFIRNVAPETKIADIYRLFAGCGELSGCVIATAEDGTPRGFAYVSYENKDTADKAIEQLNGANLAGRQLFVCHHMDKRDRAARTESNSENFTNLFIRGIAPSVSEEEFTAFFSKVGPLSSYSLPLADNGETKGFGFVNYKNHADAVGALSSIPGKKLKNRELIVARAFAKTQTSTSNRSMGHDRGFRKNYGRYVGFPQFSHGVLPTSNNIVPLPTNIYIRGLDENVTEAMLEEGFEKFGHIVSVKIMTTPDGASRGFGFVHFETADAAQDSINELHNSEKWGGRLFVAHAARKDKRNMGRAGEYMPNYGYYPVGMPATVDPSSYMYMGMMMMGQGGYYGMYPDGASVEGAAGTQDSSGAPTVSQGNPYSAGADSYSYPQWQVSPWGQYQDYYMRMMTGNQPNYGRQDEQRIQTPKASRGRGARFGRGNALSANASSSTSWIEESNSRRIKSQGDYAPSLAAAVASAENGEAERQTIGEALYQKITGFSSIKSQELAGRVTGILLEGDTEELLHLVDSESVLKLRVLQVLEAIKSWDERKSKEAAQTSA